jgi:cytochrome c peroxidase
MRIRLSLMLMAAVGAAATLIPEQQATLKPPPIPKAGPLARPKSLGQVGVPAAATRALIPSDNPQTPEKIALGQRLFFDGRLSADRTVACSTCHDPARAFTDGRITQRGPSARSRLSPRTLGIGICFSG